MYKFNAEKTKDEVVTWIRDWFDINGRECNAVIGVSGGVDSSVVASLCVEALGKDKVFGVKLPCGVQPDINFATQLINHLEIKHCTVNILNAVNAIKNKFPKDINISNQTIINLPARIRMSTCLLYTSPSPRD